ncbi:MAG: acyl carrier protein [Candidatus Paceibacterota bacterium]
MPENSLEEKVKKIVAELFKKDISEINENTAFVNDLKATSIDTIALLAALEGEFKIKIPSEEVLEGKTVGSLIDYLKKNLNL